jgi:hypothetical protein
MLGLVVIGFVGLAMDGAVVMLAGNQLQTAADAAALAAAWYAKQDTDDARLAAVDFAEKNKVLGRPVELQQNVGNDPAGDVVLGRYHQTAGEWCPAPPCFYPDDPRPNAVKVSARRTRASPAGQVPLVFGALPFFDVQGVNVTRSSMAMLAGTSGAGVLVIEEYPESEEYCTLWMRGNASLRVLAAPGYTGEAAIQANSDDGEAICVEDAGAELMAEEINVVGEAKIHSSATVGLVLNAHAPGMVDPLRDLPAPPLVGDLGSVRIGGQYRPGYYPGGLLIQSGHSVVLDSGIYVFDGGFRIKGDAQLTASNVMIYVRSGPLDINSSGPVTITPMTEAMAADSRFAGISIFQARSNTSIARVRGTPQMNLAGTVYLPRATRADFSGHCENFGNQWIVWSLFLDGEMDLTVNYDGRFPSPNYQVYLVE